MQFRDWSSPWLVRCAAVVAFALALVSCGSAAPPGEDPVSPDGDGGAVGDGGRGPGPGPGSGGHVGGGGQVGGGGSDASGGALPPDAAEPPPADASTSPDSAAAPADAASPAAGGSAGNATGGAAGAGEGRVLFEFTDPLPAIVQSHPHGDATWFDDPDQGKVVLFRAIDGNDAKERAEIDMPKDILKNGDTVWVGWKAKLELPSPGGEWRNIYQEKSYGSYQENVPFCFRADANKFSLLDPGAKALWTHPMILGKWFSILMKIVYGVGQTGTIELWIDGEPQKFSNGTTVAHLGTWGGGTQNMHWGVYRKGTIGGTDLHYVAHLRVATTQALATPP
jgi:hypothetical protein